MGKTIRLFLVDGSSSGIRTAEIGNWTGSVLVTPRPRLADIASREEVGRTGVYFLIGDDPKSGGRPRVYIGEADNVFDRLKFHNQDAARYYWTDTLFITSKDRNLTKAHARYLESRLIQITLLADRAVLDNATRPEPAGLPESDVSDMDDFLEQIKVVLPVLGFQFLQPSTISQIPLELSGPAPTFELAQGKFHATAKEIEGEFIVQKGSVARKDPQRSWTFLKARREDLVLEGKLEQAADPDCLTFMQDVPFSSPSAAAAVVLARNTNGRTEWKVAGQAITYAQWAERELERVRATVDKAVG